MASDKLESSNKRKESPEKEPEVKRRKIFAHSLEVGVWVPIPYAHEMDNGILFKFHADVQTIFNNARNKIEMASEDLKKQGRMIHIPVYDNKSSQIRCDTNGPGCVEGTRVR